MTESTLHKTLKTKISEGLQELGYNTKQEAVIQQGRLDVLGVKDGKEMKVEVVNTHCPDWILAEAKGIKRKNQPKKKKPLMTIPNLVEILKSKKTGVKKRILTTPCCKYQQATKKNVGDLIFCTKCHNPFVEK